MQVTLSVHSTRLRGLTIRNRRHNSLLHASTQSDHPPGQSGTMSAVPPLDVAIVRDRYTSNPMICFTCHGLLIRPHETIEESTPAAYDFKTIAQSASDGCLICKIYHLDLMRDNAPEQLSLTGSVSFVSGSALESESDKMVAKYLHLHTDTDNGPQRVSIPLLSALSCDSNSQAQNDCSLFPATFPVQTPIEAINTGDNRCLEMVASWLQTCRLNHQDCNANLSHTYSIIRPTRVIDASATMVRLVSNVDWASDQFPSYITVSHKWRSTGMIKLLKSNLEGMHRGFQEQALPAVFRDAIILARALKIRYVWIDALCIVQDDPDELQNEISNMGHIYRNAVLNVGALQAAEVEMKEEQESPGLFADRDPQAISPFALTIQRSDYTRNHFAYQDVVLEKLNWSSLMKCGWVLQERLLSRRSIYFGDRLWWECSENLACEGFPGRLPEFYKDGFWPGKNTPYRIINMLRRAGQDGRYEHSSPAGWHDLVSTFSGCNLSFEQDYLVALSGLAHEFQVTLGDEYYAGLWGQNLCDGLLWHRNTSHYNDDGVRPKEYRGKSRCQRASNLLTQ
jgi:hypothetical protein